jgi:3-deoxy-D-manno-octulosonic-acid transferase
MILQSGLIDNAGNQLINYGAIGVMVVLFGAGIYFLVKYVKILQENEKTRLIKDNDELDQKVGILYAEIKTMQEGYSDKLHIVLQETNEIHKQTVDALNKTTDALNNNSQIFNKLLDKL